MIAASEEAAAQCQCIVEKSYAQRSAPGYLGNVSSFVRDLTKLAKQRARARTWFPWMSSNIPVSSATRKTTNGDDSGDRRSTSTPDPRPSTGTSASSFDGDSGTDEAEMFKYNLTRDLTIDERLEEIGGPMPLLSFKADEKDMVPVKCGVKRRTSPLREIQFDFTSPANPEPEYTSAENNMPIFASAEDEEDCIKRNDIVYIRPDAHTELCDMEELDEVPPVVDVHKLMGPAQPKLLFDSMFESGNLIQATLVKTGKLFQEYDLLLQNDLLTNGHTQWYFFSIANATKGLKVKLNIVNMRKSGSLYNEGMQPCTYSKFAEEKNIIGKKGWRRSGKNVGYRGNKGHPRLGIRDDMKKWYHLTWTHTFDFGCADTVFFAMSVPYTYSDLRRELAYLRNDEKRSSHITYKKLCDSVAGNEVPLLTITERKKKVGDGKNRRYIVISSRVHPGESNASWMMRGILEFLTSDEEMAQTLRQNFVFKIVPMLNPDGVINGNYRCNLSGVDLNRRWRGTNKFLHPTIFALKDLIGRTKSSHDLVMYLDLHGHSRKKNVFMYGCCKKVEGDDKIDYGALRLPYLQDIVSPSFSFINSSFHVSKSKAATARVVTWRELGVRMSYTIESSFCGASIGSKAGMQFRTSDFENIGSDCCRTMIEFFRLEGCTEVADALPALLRPKLTAVDAHKTSHQHGIDLDEKLLASIIGDDEGSGALVEDDGSASDISDDNMDVGERNTLMQESLRPSSTAKKSKIFKVKKKKAKKKEIKPRKPRTYSSSGCHSKEKKEPDLPGILPPKAPAQKRPDAPPAGIAQSRLTTAEFLRLRVERSTAKRTRNTVRTIPSTNIGMDGHPIGPSTHDLSRGHHQYALDPNYEAYKAMSVQNSHRQERPPVRHGLRHATLGTSTPTFFFPPSPLSTDSQFGTMNTVTAIRALKQALAKGETPNLTGGFGEARTSQNASQYTHGLGSGYARPNNDPSMFSFNRASSYPDIFQSAGSAAVGGGRSISPIRKGSVTACSMLEKRKGPASHNFSDFNDKERNQSKTDVVHSTGSRARLSLQNFELPERGARFR